MISFFEKFKDIISFGARGANEYAIRDVSIILEEVYITDTGTAETSKDFSSEVSSQILFFAKIKDIFTFCARAGTVNVKKLLLYKK